jgi:hypothetical protein
LFNYLGYLQIPIILLPLALLAWSFKKPKDGLGRPAIFIAATIPLVIWTGGLGSGTAWWAFLMLTLLAASLVQNLSRQKAMALQLVIFLVLVVINRKDFASCWGTISGNIKADLGEQLTAARNLQPTAEHPLLVDGWTARYMYDYQLPKGAMDAEWCVPFPGAGPGTFPTPNDSLPQLRKGDIFVVGYFMRHSLEDHTYLDRMPPREWSAFGLQRLAFEKYPRWVYVIPSADCKAVRSNASMTLPGSE